MLRDPWGRALVILLTIIAAGYLLEKLLVVGRAFVDIVGLLTMAWLLGLILQPLVHWLSARPFPYWLTRLVQKRMSPTVARQLEGLHLPYGLAVAVVYLGLLMMTVLLAIFLIPAVLSQISMLSTTFPRYISEMPRLLDNAQQELDKFNLGIDLRAMYQPSDVADRAQQLGTALAQNAFAVATRIAAVASSLVMVYILSFYIMVDGHKLARRIGHFIPPRYLEEATFASQTVDRSFGGFIRGEILIGSLYGVGAFVAMAIARVNFSLAVSFLAALITLIPALGEPIAMVLPALMALIQGSPAALPLLIIMTAYQQVLLRVLMPRIMSDMTGMPAVLTMVSVIVSVRLVGFWGLVYGIPVAGAVYTIALFFLERRRLKQDAQHSRPEARE